MKRSISYLFAFITILLFTSSTSTIVRMDMGEPVPGAEILVEQEPNDVPINVAPCVTNNEGEVSFTIPSDQFKKLPDKFQLKVTIKPNDPTKYVLTRGAKNTMIFKFKKSDGPNIRLILSWEENAPIKGPGGTANKIGGKYMGPGGTAT
ncbi:MAG: hypothetical protein WC879_18690, partial [Melioribacteraceae bacterium]